MSEFEKVKKLINSLHEEGLTFRARGYCLAASDIVQKLLKHNDIDSYLQECSLMVINKNTDSINLVGYPFDASDLDIKTGNINTHVVCITRTEDPILIDLSIGHFLSGVPYICQKLNVQNKETEINFLQGKFIYTLITKNCKIPEIHQRSIVDRIKTDKKIFSSIDRMTKILILVSVVTTINFFRGWYDFGQKYIIKNNNFGPNKTLVK